MDFRDVVREGDGDRLFDIYKVVLLLYKIYGYYKYVYVILFYLVKCIVIFFKQQVLSCKWNRFYNGIGGKGINIFLDYKKEFQYFGLKFMWRQLGLNLNELSVERIVGILEIVDLIYEFIDRDCFKEEKYGYRIFLKDQDVVKQIVDDLISCQVFKKINGCEGYLLFLEFNRSLMYGLDYRDLYNWMQE